MFGLFVIIVYCVKTALFGVTEKRFILNKQDGYILNTVDCFAEFISF